MGACPNPHYRSPRLDSLAREQHAHLVVDPVEQLAAENAAHPAAALDPDALLEGSKRSEGDAVNCSKASLNLNLNKGHGGHGHADLKVSMQMSLLDELQKR